MKSRSSKPANCIPAYRRHGSKHPLSGSKFLLSALCLVALSLTGMTAATQAATDSTGTNAGCAVNLALGMPVVVSSVEAADTSASYAVDGDTSSRWSSEYSDPQWIYVDLGATYAIDQVVLNWHEAAYGSGYDIQVSDDAQNWVTVFAESNGDGGIDDISFAPVSARYVRLLGLQRGTGWGYSLWEIQVYGANTPAQSSWSSKSDSTTGSGTIDPVTNTAPVIGCTPATSVVAGSAYSFHPTATDADGDPLTFSISNQPSWASFSSSTGLLSGAPAASGSYGNIVISVSDGQASASLPAFSIDVLPSAAGNLALGKPVVASSVDSPDDRASYAADGDTSSRWSSWYSDPQWIYVDLGATYAIDQVVLNWHEAAYGSGYDIQVSDDAQNWVTVFAENNGDGGIDDISFAPVSARYVRLLGLQRGTGWGYSLWEIQVYGASATGQTSGITSSGTSNSGTSSSGTTSGSTTSPGTSAVQTGSLTLQWIAPVSRADGTPLSLSDIDGYHIHYGTSPGNYPSSVDVTDGTTQSASVNNLPAGTYYVVMTTYDVNGLESAYSSMVSKLVQ